MNSTLAQSALIPDSADNSGMKWAALPGTRTKLWRVQVLTMEFLSIADTRSKRIRLYTKVNYKFSRFIRVLPFKYETAENSPESVVEVQTLTVARRLYGHTQGYAVCYDGVPEKKQYQIQKNRALYEGRLQI